MKSERLLIAGQFKVATSVTREHTLVVGVVTDRCFLSAIRRAKDIHAEAPAISRLEFHDYFQAVTFDASRRIGPRQVLQQ